LNLFSRVKAMRKHMKSSDAKASKCHLKLNDHFYQACIFKFSNFT